MDWSVEGGKPKTSAAYNLLKTVGLSGKKVTLLISINDALTAASFANIPTVKVIAFDQANAFNLAQSDHWVFLKKDLDQFKGMAEKWI